MRGRQPNVFGFDLLTPATLDRTTASREEKRDNFLFALLPRAL